MADPIFQPVEPGDGPEGPLGRRLLWFAAISLISMIVVSAVAYALKALLFIG